VEQARAKAITKVSWFNARRRLRCAVVAGLALMLTSCAEGDEEPANVPPASPTPSFDQPTPTGAPSAVIGEVVWALSVQPGTNAPDEVVDAFETSTRVIIAVVEVSNLPANSALSASWSYNGVPLDSMATGAVAQADVSAGYVEFRLERDDAVEWPDGTYEVALSLNGRTVRSAKVEVRPA
jgi:hypothetical protein